MTSCSVLLGGQQDVMRRQTCLPIVVLAFTLAQYFAAADRADAQPTGDKPASRQDDIGESAGIGVALRELDGTIVVQAVVPDSPAERNRGIHVGDRLLSVAQSGKEPVSVKGRSVSDVVAMIRGKTATAVRLTVIPQGKSENDSVVVSLIRGNVKALNVFGDGELLQPKTAIPDLEYVRLSNLAKGRMHQHSGKLIVLEFWASWCGPCLQALDKSEAILEKHPEWADKIEIVAVGVDEEQTSAIKCVENRQWKRLTTVWAGTDVLRPYHVAYLPVIYFVGPDQRILEANQRIDLEAQLKMLLAWADKRQPTDDGL